MHIKIKTKAAVCVTVAIISLMLLVLCGMAMTGGEFFNWVARGFHYIYEFMFNRAFDYKTGIVLGVIVLTLAGLIYWLVVVIKSADNIQLHELVAPFTTVLMPFMILAAVRGRSLGVWDSEDGFLVVLALIALIIYVIASCGTLFYFYRSTYVNKLKRVKPDSKKEVKTETTNKENADVAVAPLEEVVVEKGEPIYDREFVKVILERMEKAGTKLQKTEVEEALEKVREEKELNRVVKIAVRPEAFEVDKKGVIPVNVSNVEHIGRDVSVVGHISEQDNKVRILIPSELRDQLTSEQLHFSPKKYYVFETSGKRLK